LAQRLAREVDGEVLFDAASRGRYATDASIYQVMPIGIVVPRTAEAAIAALEIAAESGTAILPRGAGTSQCGQTVGAALVIDDSKFLHRVLAVDAAAREDREIAELARKARSLFEREKDEIAARYPKTARNVAGYNLNRLVPNLASLLVGSEGTLAWFERIEIELAELPRHRALGVAHFPRFYDAMQAAQHIVKLGPSAVELVDRTMIDLALSNAAFAPIIRRFVRG